VGLGYADVVQLRTHIVGHNLDKLTVLGQKIAEIWGAKPPVQTLTGAALLSTLQGDSRGYVPAGQHSVSVRMA
jgi:hypothetical protein